VRDLALKGAESRLAGLLVQLAGAKGEPTSGQRLQLRYTRREVAEMIGVSTETAIRLLGKLKQRKAITVDHREVTITDLDKLTKLAHYDDMEA
jgi:CRP/FNR family transcriptional regulator, cyclic AMP receptor protein